MHVEIKQFPELRVAAIRHIGPYNQIGQAFGRLGSIAGPAGLFQHPGAAMVGLYHDAPGAVPPDQLRSDAGVVVPPGVPIPGGLAEQTIPAGAYACTVHAGSYEGLGDTWARLMGGWLVASGRRMGPGPSCEVYLNDPSRVAKEDLRTEIRIPVLAG